LPAGSGDSLVYRLLDSRGAVRGTLVVFHAPAAQGQPARGQIFFQARTEVKGPGTLHLSADGHDLRIVEPEEPAGEPLAATQPLPEEEQEGFLGTTA